MDQLFECSVISIGIRTTSSSLQSGEAFGAFPFLCLHVPLCIHQARCPALACIKFVEPYSTRVDWNLLIPTLRGSCYIRTHFMSSGAPSVPITDLTKCMQLRCIGVCIYCNKVSVASTKNFSTPRYMYQLDLQVAHMQLYTCMTIFMCNFICTQMMLQPLQRHIRRFVMSNVRNTIKQIVSISINYFAYFNVLVYMLKCNQCTFVGLVVYVIKFLMLFIGSYRAGL